MIQHTDDVGQEPFKVCCQMCCHETCSVADFKVSPPYTSGVSQRNEIEDTCVQSHSLLNSTDDSPQVPNAAPRPGTIPRWDTCTRVEMCCEFKRFARKETGQNAWPSTMDEFNVNNAPALLS